ncbi:MAG: hypothetical protein KIS81_08060 [Maricaulaceae bacterium]|nr:hypothetical protein [Maricaulaceae bacterium]
MDDAARKSRFSQMAASAERYGELSFENYSQIRSFAERASEGFCAFLRGQGEAPCAHLVPPDGPWVPAPHRSGAFSVSGAGFLPLEPIAFGLAVRVSNTGDWLRLTLTCAKQGPELEVSVSGGRSYSFDLPLRDEQLQEFFQLLFDHIKGWFDDESDHYENGAYGGRGMGFDFAHVD